MTHYSYTTISYVGILLVMLKAGGSKATSCVVFSYLVQLFLRSQNYKVVNSEQPMKLLFLTMFP